MRAWQGWTLAGVIVASAMIVIPAERSARRLREEERRAEWKAYWEVARPRAWHELPILDSPSVVPELQVMHFDTSR